MPKGYWIAHVTVNDPATYKGYFAANAEVFKKWNAKFVVRGGRYEVRKGPAHQRHVVLEFESFEVAKACYDSPEYQAAAAIRDRAADVSIIIVEGYDGSPPKA